MTVEDLKYALKDVPDKATVVFERGGIGILIEHAEYLKPSGNNDDFTFGRLALS